MPRGASKKREKEYDKLVHEFREERRYKGRAREVAARIVNKQRARFGETKKRSRGKAEGKAADSEQLPIRDYERLTVPQIEQRLERKPTRVLEEIKRFEQQHKSRKTLLAAIERRLKKAA